METTRGSAAQEEVFSVEVSSDSKIVLRFKKDYTFKKGQELAFRRPNGLPEVVKKFHAPTGEERP